MFVLREIRHHEQNDASILFLDFDASEIGIYHGGHTGPIKPIQSYRKIIISNWNEAVQRQRYMQFNHLSFQRKL